MDGVLVVLEDNIPISVTPGAVLSWSEQLVKRIWIDSVGEASDLWRITL